MVTVSDRFGSAEVLRFQFRVVRLWELPSAAFLGTPSLAPLVPFASNASEATVEEAIRVLERVEPEARRVELRVALAMLAGNVFPGRDWLVRIPAELLMASTTYQQILSKGHLEGERDTVAALLSTRLQEEAARLVARLPRASGDQIKEAVTLLGSLRDDAELIAALDRVLPQ